MTLTQYLRNGRVRLFGSKEQKDLIKLINGNLGDAERAAMSGRPGFAGQCLECALKLSRRVPQYDISKKVSKLTNNYTIVYPTDA